MARTPEEIKLRAKEIRLYNTYGLSLEKWNLMYEEQGRVCKICQTLPKSGILCVDHRHILKYKKLPPEERCKEVRGLLCFTCNVFLGKLEKRKNARFVLEQTVKYFSIYKIKGDI